MNLNGNAIDKSKHVAPKSSPTPASTDALLDAVDVRVETYLSETTMSVAKLNELKAGSIVPLDTLLSDLVELRVNGVRVAHGELVAVGDKFGVRIVSLS